MGMRRGFYIPALSLVEWEWVVKKFTFLLIWSPARICFKTPRSETTFSVRSHINSFQFVTWIHKVQPKTSYNRVHFMRKQFMKFCTSVLVFSSIRPLQQTVVFVYIFARGKCQLKYNQLLKVTI